MATNLHAVVFTVNHEYDAIARAVIAAKSQPNLYVYKMPTRWETLQHESAVLIRTSIPQTKEISRAVGAMRNMIAWMRNAIPLEFCSLS